MEESDSCRKCTHYVIFLFDNYLSFSPFVLRNDIFRHTDRKIHIIMYLNTVLNSYASPCIVLV